MILIGIDGASPRFVEELIGEGKLPNLAKIAECGVHGELRSEMPIYSPRIWNTIATGKSPQKHGIVGFAYVGPDGRHHLYVSTDRQTRTLWSIASQAGLSVGVVNFWNTYPLEKVNGVMVSDHVLAKEIEGRRQMMGAEAMEVGEVIYPEDWSSRLSKMVQEKATPLPDFGSPFAEGKALPRWAPRDGLQRRFEEDGALARMAQEISKIEESDVMMVLLTGIDRVSHHIWGVLESPDVYPAELIPTAAGRRAGRAALAGYYEYTDALIGSLISDFGSDDLVMIVSDHGFEAGHAMLTLTGVHETKKSINGIIYACGSGVVPGSTARDVSINDITPTLLAWLGLPVARDMDGRKASFLITEEVLPVDTYDTIDPEFVNHGELPSGVEDEIVEQLRSLGYIDDDGSDASDDDDDVE